MSKPTIESKFAEICAKGVIAPIQIAPVTRLIDTQYPDDIRAIKGSSKSHVIMLEYYAEGISIAVEVFKIVLKDHIHNDQIFIFNLDDEIALIQRLFAERVGYSQVAAIRAILASFNCTAEWVENWCVLTVSIESYIVIVTVLSTTAAVDLYSANKELLRSTSGLDITKPELIVSCIAHSLKMIDKTVTVTTQSYPSAETSVFSGKRNYTVDSPKVSFPEDDVQERLSQDGAYVKDVSVAAKDISQLKVQQVSKSSCITIDEINKVLESLAYNVNDNCKGTFADGWREAIIAVVNRINLLK